MSRKPDIHSVTDVLETTRPGTEQGTRISVAQLLNDLEGATFPPVLLVSALVVVSPLSGVPGLSSVLGIVIALVSAQMLMDRQHIWLPSRIKRIRISTQRYRRALDWLKPFADWLDQRSRDRLQLLVTRPMNRIPQLLCLLAGLMMPVLELVPFTSSILGLFVATQATAMLVRDGLIALLGTGIALALGTGAFQLVATAQASL